MTYGSGVDTGRRRAIAVCLAGMAAMALPAGAQAAEWPAGPVQLYVPAGPGGGTDVVGRLLAEALQKTQRRPFVIVNLPSGGGAVAAEQVRNARPDGRTLLFFHTGLLSAYHTGAYGRDPLAEFTLIAGMPAGSSYAVVVAADSPYATMDDLVTAAKAKPGSLTMGVQLRNSTHFMGGLIAKDSGAQFRFVEAGSDGDKLVQLQGHQIDSALINASGTKQYVEAGSLRVLGTVAGTPERDPLMPDIPSLSELGYPSAVFGFDFLVLGPKGLDDAMVQDIHDAFAEAVASPSVTDRLGAMGMPVKSLSRADANSRLAAIDTQIEETARELGLK